MEYAEAAGSANGGEGRTPGFGNDANGDMQVAANSPLKFRSGPPDAPLITGDPYIDSTTARLQSIAMDALYEVGPGSGPTYGTAVHAVFARMVMALGRPDLFVETSFDSSGVAQYGANGSVRTDVILGRNALHPVAIYDLKTGGATLTPKRASQILNMFPNKVKGGVIMIRVQWVDKIVGG